MNPRCLDCQKWNNDTCEGTLDRGQMLLCFEKIKEGNVPKTEEQEETDFMRIWRATFGKRI